MSSTKNLVNSARNYSYQHAQIHGEPTRSPDAYKKHSCGAYVSEDHGVVARQKVTIRANPNTSVASNLLSGGQVEYRLEKGIIDLLTHAYLDINITNSTGANLTLAPIQTCVNRIEFYSGNGSELLAVIFDQELYLSNMFFSRNEIEQLDSYLGLGANYATTGTVVADGETRSFYLPVTYLLQNTKIFLAGLKSELLIKFYFNSSTLNLIAGAAPIVNNATLLLKGFYEEPAQSQKRKELYMGNTPIIMPFMNFQRMNQPLTLAPSSTYSIVLSGIRGISAGIIFTIRPTAITAANQSNYELVESYDLQNASGESMIGYYRMNDADHKIEAAEMFDNLFASFKNFYVIPFSSHITWDYTSGANNGFSVFTGFEKLSFTTPSTLVGGAYTIDIRCLTHESIIVKQGTLSSTKS